MIHPDLKRLDARDIPRNEKEVLLFSVMQNEELRLPYYLDYYRSMGVSRFFIIDNHSTDGTQPFLLSQPDCYVFYTEGSYVETRFGVDWLNSLMDEYAAGHWIVLADADELMVYPHSEKNNLPRLCAWLDSRGYEGVYALMLDVYSKGPLNQVNYRKGENFLTATDHFDLTYHFVRRFSFPFSRPAFPPIEPIGGPRLRLCFPEQNTKKVWPRLRVKLMRRFLNLAHRAGFMKSVKTRSVAPQVFKIPLVKWKHGNGFITSHRLNPIRLATLTGALLHFKYFQDFSARVQYAINNLNHYDGSAEYRRYGELVAENPELSMAYAGSVLYKGSEQLMQLMLVRTDPEWNCI